MNPRDQKHAESLRADIAIIQAEIEKLDAEKSNKKTNRLDILKTAQVAVVSSVGGEGVRLPKLERIVEVGFCRPTESMPTAVKQADLERCTAQLPQRLHQFMDNFFGTCEHFDPGVNYLNYLNDLRLYERTTPTYRAHRMQLVKEGAALINVLPLENSSKSCMEVQGCTYVAF